VVKKLMKKIAYLPYQFFLNVSGNKQLFLPHKIPCQQIIIGVSINWGYKVVSFVHLETSISNIAEILE